MVYRNVVVGVSRMKVMSILMWVWFLVDYVMVKKMRMFIEVFLRKLVLLVRSEVELIYRVMVNFILK